MQASMHRSCHQAAVCPAAYVGYSAQELLLESLQNPNSVQMMEHAVRASHLNTLTKHASAAAASDDSSITHDLVHDLNLLHLQRLCLAATAPLAQDAATAAAAAAAQQDAYKSAECFALCVSCLKASVEAAGMAVATAAAAAEASSGRNQAVNAESSSSGEDVEAEGAALASHRTSSSSGSSNSSNHGSGSGDSNSSAAEAAQSAVLGLLQAAMTADIAGTAVTSSSSSRQSMSSAWQLLLAHSLHAAGRMLLAMHTERLLPAAPDSEQNQQEQMQEQQQDGHDQQDQEQQQQQQDASPDAPAEDQDLLLFDALQMLGSLSAAVAGLGPQLTAMQQQAAAAVPDVVPKPRDPLPSLLQQQESLQHAIDLVIIIIINPCKPYLTASGHNNRCIR
jgi:hypothetical protein